MILNKFINWPWMLGLALGLNSRLDAWSMKILYIFDFYTLTELIKIFLSSK